GEGEEGQAGEEGGGNLLRGAVVGRQGQRGLDGRGRVALDHRLQRYGNTIGGGRRSQDATDDGRRKPGLVKGDGEDGNGRIGERRLGECAATSLLAVAEEQQRWLHAVGTERSGQAKGGREIARVAIEIR